MIVDEMQNLIGKPAPEVYTGVISSLPDVQEMAVAQYSVPPPIQARACLTGEEQQLVARAAKARETTRLSFLEVLLEMSASAHLAIDGILDAVSYHQKHSVNRTWLSRKEVLKGGLLRVCAKPPSSNPLAFLSKVRTGSDSFNQIPLLDFHIEKSKQSLSMVQSIAQRLLDKEYLVLETERSYHVVGLQLLTENQAMLFLSKAILFSPITDHAYIAHQLLEGESALRITSHTNADDVPRLVTVCQREN
ncbi:MAG: hypothetical protein JXM79_21440 [Sedimentisphaerales bacterium]|nr:hypothetical protein [Sedimentisphaerales bacterium]